MEKTELMILARFLRSRDWGRQEVRQISQRTTEALRVKKAAGMQVGRPRGPGKSKLDAVRPEIEALLANGATPKFIAQRYHTTEANLHNWLKKWGLTKPTFDKTGVFFFRVHARQCIFRSRLYVFYVVTMFRRVWGDGRSRQRGIHLSTADMVAGNQPDDLAPLAGSQRQ